MLGVAIREGDRNPFYRTMVNPETDYCEAIADLASGVWIELFKRTRTCVFLPFAAPSTGAFGGNNP